METETTAIKQKVDETKLSLTQKLETMQKDLIEKSEKEITEELQELKNKMREYQRMSSELEQKLEDWKGDQTRYWS